MSEAQGFRPYLQEARESVVSIEAEQATERMAEDSQLFILDVRQTEEFSEGALPGAIHIPRGVLELAVEERIPIKDSLVVVYCASGIRSVFAARTLAEIGYTNVVSLEGGFTRWKDEGRTWEQPAPLKRPYTKGFLATET